MRRDVRREVPGPGQESVWDYPRPPAVERSDEHVVVTFAGRVVADTRRSLRVLETSHAPVYYAPAADVDGDLVRRTQRTSWCEYKGQASYLDVVVGEAVSPLAAWTYLRPAPGYELLAGALAFYPERVDRCTVDGETVRGVDGDFYGGWITSRVVGPFKGGPGTLGW